MLLSRSSVGLLPCRGLLRPSNLLRSRLVRGVVAVVGNLSVLGGVQACKQCRLRLIRSYLRGLTLRLNWGRRGLMLDNWARLNWLSRTWCSYSARVLRLGLMLAPSIWL